MRHDAPTDCFLEGPSFDRDGNLFVVDIPFGRILKITPDRKFDRNRNPNFYSDRNHYGDSHCDLHSNRYRYSEPGRNKHGPDVSTRLMRFDGASRSSILPLAGIARLLLFVGSSSCTC